MPVFMTAKAILKEKGYVENKFDGAKFINDVGQFFRDNGIESKLLLLPFRFLDIKRDKDEPYNPFDITDEEEKQGWKVQTAVNESTGELVWVNELIERDWESFREQLAAGVAVQRIIIDKPFAETAAKLLSVMGGYVVDKKRTKRNKLYWVSLL